MEGARGFSDKIFIVVSSHFFDGTPENQELLHRSYKEFSDCEFIEYAFDETNLYGWNPPQREYKIERAHHWHNTSRYIGMHFVKTDYVLFLDADEVIDKIRMKKWLDQGIYKNFDCLHFFAYRYQQLPSMRGERYMNTALLVKREKIALEELFHRCERPGFFKSFQGKKMSGVLGLDGLPLLHHYSWVRTNEEFKQKIGSWGHKFDFDWNSAPKEEVFGFSKVIHTHPFCNPLAVPVEEFKQETRYRLYKKEEFSNLRLVTPEKLKVVSVNSLAQISSTHEYGLTH